jgi:hypothetical protein
VKKNKPVPDDFEEVDFDPNTGKRVGWVQVGDGPDDKYHREARDEWGLPPDGTYELMGPKVQGNPMDYRAHVFIRHGSIEFASPPPRDFEGLGDFLMACGKSTEGIVWHHPDGRMAKIKKRDFEGLQ